MKKIIFSLFLAIFIGTILAYSGTKPFAADTAAGLSANEKVTSAPSCINPSVTAQPICQAMEQEIMDSTVRIMMFTSLMQVEGFCCKTVIGNGYATVKDGRYLVTHNHFNEIVFSFLPDAINHIVFREIA